MGIKAMRQQDLACMLGAPNPTSALWPKGGVEVFDRRSGEVDQDQRLVGGRALELLHDQVAAAGGRAPVDGARVVARVVARVNEHGVKAW